MAPIRHALRADEYGPALAIAQRRPAAFQAIAATLPLGSAGYENQTNERCERYVWLAPNVVDRLTSLFTWSIPTEHVHWVPRWRT
jgi:hypothetical protein